jgi:hypothetical protein
MKRNKEKDLKNLELILACKDITDKERQLFRSVLDKIKSGKYAISDTQLDKVIRTCKKYGLNEEKKGESKELEKSRFDFENMPRPLKPPLCKALQYNGR